MEWKLKIETDIDSILLFSIIVTNKTLDLFIYNEKDKKTMPLESIITWERSFQQVKKRKVKRYKKFVEECEEHKWKTKLNRAAVSRRDFVEKVFIVYLENGFPTLKNNFKK